MTRRQGDKVTRRQGDKVTHTPRSGAVRWDLGFAICHLSFAILALALLWPVVVHPGWWLWSPGAAHSDLAVTHWPNAHFTRRVLWEESRFPLWRPTIMSGTPFAANPLTGLCYPPNWLLLFLPWLPLEVGFNLSALVHLWLAGAAMYALMRRGLGAGVWGALVAAVAYEASPKLLAHVGAGHVGWVQAWGWLPVVVWASLQVCKWASLQVCKWASLQVGKFASRQVCKGKFASGQVCRLEEVRRWGGRPVLKSGWHRYRRV